VTASNSGVLFIKLSEAGRECQHGASKQECSMLSIFQDKIKFKTDTSGTDKHSGTNLHTTNTQRKAQIA
jgi:hypothetical protein